MPSLKLSALFRRDPNRTDLKQRAAELKANLGKRSRHQPEPGSDEAKAAFKAACHEHTLRTQFANGYPELKRTILEWWTASSLGKALETGELTPAECARLYPLATERELRMAEIEHELNLGGLFALAFADEYPVTPMADDPDPIHAVIADSYRAEDAMKVFGLDPTSTSRPNWFLRERALTEAQSATRDAVWRTTPTTRAGRLALVDYARFQVALFTGSSVEDPDCPAYLFRDIMSAVTAAFEADCAPASDSAVHDLSGCDLAQLARLYETWEGVFHHLTGAGAIPCFTSDRRSGFTPAGEVLDREYDRAGAFLSAIADEVRSRTAVSSDDRHERLGVLIRHELNTNGRPVDDALLSELNAQPNR
ncbi:MULTISPECIES: hypothetical protein [unclassified Methylobacterium]|uniref:hypothetical protein n=1 Tax=unclassified Methylobacterium TaxID=2615210 RepID=UPI001FB9ECC8|nr:MULTISPECIES: hypothetical protein [unclassified Methylobacterium]MCJ2092077.1 hypothetical protein [Methylobacterium sp. J-072]MCJ2139755.1 hypothetical protein [Methylobacterium sp. E-066]